jgi:DNA-directed RNA polymerase III subunit RPC4
MPPATRGGGARGGARGGRGGRGRGVPSHSASRPSSDNPIPSSEPPPQIDERNMDRASPRVSATAATVSDIVSGPSTPADSRTSQTPGAASRGSIRFKPKNVRRDEAERKRLEEARKRELLSKIKAEERELRQEEGRARRGRGRGGMSRGLVRRTVTSSGPFSAIASGMSSVH